MGEHFIQNQSAMGNENKTQKTCNFCILKRYNSMLFIILKLRSWLQYGHMELNVVSCRQ